MGMHNLRLEIRVDRRGVPTLRIRDDIAWRSKVADIAIPALVRMLRVLGFTDVVIDIVPIEEW